MSKFRLALCQEENRLNWVTVWKITMEYIALNSVQDDAVRVQVYKELVLVFKTSCVV